MPKYQSLFHYLTNFKQEYCLIFNHFPNFYSSLPILKINFGKEFCLLKKLEIEEKILIDFVSIHIIHRL